VWIVLHIVPIYCGSSHDLLAPLAAKLAEVFGLPVQQHPPSFDPELAFDPSRGQYNSRVLLAQLLDNHPQGAARVLGVAGVDLFIPVLTYVFGEAQLDGRAAVVSTYRLDNQIYGLPPDNNLLFERLAKEAIHELGHTYNLVHCHKHPCVMMSSTYVDGIDAKSDRFCGRCRRSLG
jgi:archaemetzincin